MSIIAITTLACMVAAFLVCGIPSGLIIAKHSKEHVDVRTVGSGNIGMTNVARSAGAGAAALTFLCDAGKGLVAMLLCRLVVANVALGGDFAATSALGEYGWVCTLLYMCCVLGHVYSPYLGFHGGKGISVGFGAALGLYWPVALLMLVVFLVLAVPSRYVSLGSVAADIALPIISFALGIRGLSLIPICVVTVVVAFAHRKNIVKLANGTERKFTVHKSGGEGGHE
ncbi:MAG: glycerol-3-phosphate acyltransferase [Parafannyhessea sp.]|uniref:glycerol-3-phosphate acyltransferase n=1 Tax=Parafannyhessea sp. TaxID=2847324 RepID=UPI003F038A3E